MNYQRRITRLAWHYISNYVHADVFWLIKSHNQSGCHICTLQRSWSNHVEWQIMTNCVWIKEPLRTSCLIPFGVAFGFLAPVTIMILHFWLQMSNSMRMFFRGFSAAICKVIVSDWTAVFHTLYFLMGSFIFSSVSKINKVAKRRIATRLCRRVQMLSHKVWLEYQSIMLLTFVTHTELHVIYVTHAKFIFDEIIRSRR